jgi:hypothetical protein
MLGPAAARDLGEGMFRVSGGAFRSKWIESDLHFYVALSSKHPTNHFYVAAMSREKGQLAEALVYWKEEQTILHWSDIAPEGRPGAQIFAWDKDYWKFGKDTLPPGEDGGTSTFPFVSHRVWKKWRAACVSKGKPYTITLKNAKRLFPKI